MAILIPANPAFHRPSETGRQQTWTQRILAPAPPPIVLACGPAQERSDAPNPNPRPVLRPKPLQWPPSTSPERCHAFFQIQIPSSGTSRSGTPSSVEMPADNYSTLSFYVAPQPSNGPPTASPERNVIGKRKGGGRPPANSINKRRKTAAKTRPRLRRNREVETDIPQDIWFTIFKFCQPADLRKLRAVSRGFRYLLSYQKVWEESRINTFGKELPSPPAALGEYDYLQLLDGSACMRCRKRGIRKTYWVFLKRWCEACFNAQVVPESQIRHVLEMRHSQLLECIVSAQTDSWGGYQGVWVAPDQTTFPTHHVRPGRLFLSEDVHRIHNEFEEFFASLSNQPSALPSATETDGPELQAEQIEEWINTRKETTRKLLQHLKAIEDWQKNVSRDRSQQNNSLKKARETYFQHKSLKLESPLRSSALALIGAYQRSIQIAKAPTEKCWQALKPKVEQAREKAEWWARYEEDADQQGYWQFLQDYQARRLARDGDKDAQKLLREQNEANGWERFLIKLANFAIKQVSRGRQLEAQDFVLQVLRFVWQKYESLPVKPQSPLARQNLFRCKTEDGKYALSIEDAQKVYRLSIEPYLRTSGYFHDSEQIKATKLFRCTGCKRRKGCTTLYAFDAIFEHICLKHAVDTGDFVSFRLAGSSPKKLCFAAVPWTRNLPVLPQRQQATGSWDPDADLDWSSAANT